MGYVRLDLDEARVDKLLGALGSMEDIEPSTVFKGLEAGGTILLEAVKANAPVRTGRLRNAMRMNRHLGLMPYVDIRFDEKKKKKGGARYWWLVEYGHGGPHPAPPHPFLEPAIKAVEEEAMQAVCDAIAMEFLEGW